MAKLCAICIYRPHEFIEHVFNTLTIHKLSTAGHCTREVITGKSFAGVRMKISDAPLIPESFSTAEASI